jgi:putative membrane protein
MMDGMGTEWGIAMMVAMLVLTVVVIAGVVWLVVRLIRDREGSSAADHAPRGGLELLDRRFASGEIDADEYRQRRSTLDKGA